MEAVAVRAINLLMTRNITYSLHPQKRVKEIVIGKLPMLCSISIKICHLASNDVLFKINIMENVRVF